MKIKISKRNEKGERECMVMEHERITIQLPDEIDIHITVNQFGELILSKSDFGGGSDTIKISPVVSNEIAIS